MNWTKVLAATFVAAAGISVFAQTRPAGTTAQRSPATSESVARPVRVLFLGQDQERPHAPPAMYPLLAAPLARRGIQLTYVATPAEGLTPEKLAHYDALMIYGNHETLTAEQEKALVAFVEGGKGLVAIHAASAMFPSSAAYVAMVGAQFAKHGEGEFTAEIVQPKHPAMEGLKPFSTWDETYVHAK